MHNIKIGVDLHCYLEACDSNQALVKNGVKIPFHFHDETSIK